MTQSDDLKNRVENFNCLELPGQPMGMHMGTSQLVNDLWREVLRLRQLADESAPLPTQGHSTNGGK